LALGCGGRSSAGILPGLEFRGQPADSVAGEALAATVEVAVVDALGRTITSAEPLISVSLIGGDGSAVLAGDRSVQAVSGVARFSNLQVHGTGSDLSLQAVGPGLATTRSKRFDVESKIRNIVLLIADGWGFKQIEATNRYTKNAPIYASWNLTPMATWDLETQKGNGGVGYDSKKAWSDLNYLRNGPTDSASSATAMYSGNKTQRGRISVVSGRRLKTISELAVSQGRGSGAVTSVPVTHATPGAWFAHNSSRANVYAIGDEGLWGDPNTTGTPATHLAYSGGFGPTRPRSHVIIGGGHPLWNSARYLTVSMLNKLRTENRSPGAWTLVERIKGKMDGGARLLSSARDPKVERLVGLFGGSGGNLEYRTATGSGRNPENPTLAEMTEAALAVLARKKRGFALMVEGGAVDWAGHANNLDRCVGEMIGFNLAVKAAVKWIESPSTKADWTNTLVIVTGDHECGLLTAGPGVFPDRPLLEVSARTLALEKRSTSPSIRASWEDVNKNSRIDAGEKVYWAWNSIGHSNSLIPLYAKGLLADRFRRVATKVDQVRGKYMDNTEVFKTVQEVLTK
ncbi:MAG: alkaline phosphatase, partial [Planctomycetota bacterium]